MNTHTHAASLARLEGWRNFVDRQTAPPSVLSPRAYSALSQDARSAYNDARLAYVSDGISLKTDRMERATAETRREVEMNRHKASGRRSVILTGVGNTGKTFVARSVGRHIEVDHQRRKPDYRAYGQVPVAYVNMPPRATGKALATGIIQFFQPTFTAKTPTADLCRRAVDLLAHYGVALVIIDEVHNMSSVGNPHSNEAGDTIKIIQNDSTAAWVLCGIGLDNADVFGTFRGQQILSRATTIELDQYPIATAEGQSRWKSLLGGFEAKVPLHGNDPTLLTGMWKEVHTATGGRIGLVSATLERLVYNKVLAEDPSHERISQAELRDALRAATPKLAEEQVVERTVAERRKVARRRAAS